MGRLWFKYGQYRGRSCRKCLTVNVQHKSYGISYVASYLWCNKIMHDAFDIGKDKKDIDDLDLKLCTFSTNVIRPLEKQD